LEWLNRMAEAIDYMEANMEVEINIEDIARVAYSSTFHFQRMFHMITGMTVSEYMRKRKLTLAAQELAVFKNSRVLDVALKYGYDSPESFAKAFRKVHGISPSAAREPGKSLKAFPRISFHLSLKGDKDMDYRIVEKEKFIVTGKQLRVKTTGGENQIRIPKFWGECNNDGTSEKICKSVGTNIMMGICMDMDLKNEAFTYMVAAEGINKTKEADLVEREIPAATWAVFNSVGPMPHAVQRVWDRIFQEWFPSTGYEHADAPELEVYLEGDVNAEDYKCEVWIPIIRK
jgi:AraC family transcriptional regulator